MFYFISGLPALLEPSFAVIDAGGVGYKLTITLTTYQALLRQSTTDADTRVKLYTHMAVREDGVELFGFATAEELDAFKLLITVSGVGPKAAMSILSQLTPQTLTLAICTDDKKSIAMANGIGPKTAARIILELKDKIQKTSELSEFPNMGITLESNPLPTTNNNLSDAQDALIALGYSRNEAYQVLRSIDIEHMELDEIIRLALKKIMK